MDAHALLTSQGWRGTGHSLHPTSDLTGLSKPILVSRKQNTLGVGKKQHKTSDMWWMNAFDSSLKGLDTSKEGTVVQTSTSGGLDLVAKGGGKFVGKKGLYACFVRGEGLSGTLMPLKGDGLPTPEESEVEERSTSSEVSGMKRKRDEETKEQRRARKAAKKAQQSQEGTPGPGEAEIVVSTDESRQETKEERRARKAAKKALNDELQVLPRSSPEDSASETKEERRERKRLKKLAKENLVSKTEEPTAATIVESKEERKERRRLKKQAQLSATQSMENSSTESSKKDKKRRKE